MRRWQCHRRTCPLPTPYAQRCTPPHFQPSINIRLAAIKPNDGELETMDLDAPTDVIRREPRPSPPVSVSSSAAGPERLWHVVSLEVNPGL